jgi:hypothetical protein
MSARVGYALLLGESRPGGGHLPAHDGDDEDRAAAARTYLAVRAIGAGFSAGLGYSLTNSLLIDV